MQTNPIHLREQGTILHHADYEMFLQNRYWHLTVNPNQSTFNNSCPGFGSNFKSELIWIRGQENYIVALGANGRGTLHRIFPTIQSIALSKPSEKVLKMALGTSCLIMALKPNNSAYLQFFYIRNDNLLMFSPEREQILSNLEVTHEQVQEIDVENHRIIVKKSENLEVWSFLAGENRVLASIPLDLYSSYSRGQLVVGYQVENRLHILVKNLKDGKKFQLGIENGCYPYHSEVIGTYLILGMPGRPLQSFDLASGKMTVIGKCKRFYELESCNDGFLLLENGFGVFISNPENKIECGKIGRIFVNRGSELFVYSKERNAIVVISPKGILNFIRIDRMLRVNTIGISVDSQIIYVGSNKGVISVFD